MKHQLSLHVFSHCRLSTIPTNSTHTDTQSWWVRGCIHLPLSHHNTLFKLDTSRSLFFLAELIEPVQPDLPYQSVKGIFHSLQYKTQLSSMLRKNRRTYCMGACVTAYRYKKESGSACNVWPASSSIWTDLSCENWTLTSSRLEKGRSFLSLKEKGLWLD